MAEGLERYHEGYEEDREVSSKEEYPSGPITCCLQCISKKVRVRDDNIWTVSLILAWITAFLAVILYVIAFGTTGWARAVSVSDGATRRVGLWQECHSVTGCQYLTSETNIGVPFKLCQTLSVLILFILLLGTCLVLCYTFMPEASMHTRFGSGAVWCRFISVILFLIFIPVFSTKWSDPKYGTSDYTRSLGYSFKLAVVSFCLEIVGALFTYCHIAVFRQKKSKPLLQDTRIVSDYGGNQNDGYSAAGGIYPASSHLEPSQQDTIDDLSSQVFGHIDVQSAFVDFTERNDRNKSSSGVQTSHISQFKSKEDVARRFTGITLAEPEYISVHGIRVDIDRVSRSTNLSKMHDDRDQQRYEYQMDHRSSDPYHEGLYRDPQGRLVTSVSMYDLHNNSYTAGNRDLDVVSIHSKKSHVSGRTPHKQEQSNTSINGSRYTQREQESVNRHDFHHRDHQNYKEQMETRYNRGRADDSQPDARSHHSMKSVTHSQREIQQQNQANERILQNQQVNQSAKLRNMSDYAQPTGNPNKHQRRVEQRQGGNVQYQQRRNPEQQGNVQHRSKIDHQQRRNQQNPQNRDPEQRLNNQHHQGGNPENGMNVQHEQRVDPGRGAPVAPARRLRDKTRGIANNQTEQGMLNRAGRSDSMSNSYRNDHVTSPGRSTQGRGAPSLHRAKSSESLYSVQSTGRQGNSENKPPAMRVRDRARGGFSDTQVMGRLSRANSSTSIHSIVSTATSIVDGCAESEI